MRIILKDFLIFSAYTMSGILCCVISRGTTVLARYAHCAGNFSEICELVLAKIPPGDGKMSYSHGEYFYHYTSQQGLITLAISGKVDY